MEEDPILLATAGYDHHIKFWQAHSGHCVKTYQHADSQVNAMCFSPDRRLLAAAGHQHVRLYDVAGSQVAPVGAFDGLARNVTSVGFHDDGRWLYAGSEDCHVRIWDMRARHVTQQNACTRIFQVAAAVNSVQLHPNQVELYLGEQDGSVHIWDLRNNQSEQLLPEPRAAVQSISIDAMGTYLAAVNNQGDCYVWAITGTHTCSQLFPKNKLAAHPRAYGLRCLFSPDSTLLATCGADGHCCVFRTADFEKVADLSLQVPAADGADAGGMKWVWDVAFSADSQYLITASSDGVARLWSLESQQVRREYKGHTKALVCLAFRDDTPGVT